MLDFLLERDPEMQQIYDDFPENFIWVHPLFFSFGQFQNTKEEILQIHKSIQEFKTTWKESVLVFVLGVVNHWMPLVIYKEGEGAKPEFYFFDSWNLPLLDWDDLEVEDKINQLDDEHYQITGKKRRPAFNTEFYKHSVYDTRMIVHIILNLISKEETTLYEIQVRAIIYNIIKRFESTFDFILKDEHDDTEEVKQHGF